MLGEGIIQELIRKALDRIREIESIKGPNLVPGYSLLRIAAIGERAKHGLPVTEPYGPSRPFLSLDDLMFVPAMIDRFPMDPKTVITETIIGPAARRPLALKTPLMAGAYAFGLSVTKETKLCMAKGASMAGSANNSGDAGFYAPEREVADRYIVQLNRARYGNSEEQLQQADAIEIRFGQGALGGLGETIEGEDMDEELARQLGVEKGQSASRPMTHPDIQMPSDLKALVNRVRDMTGGVPIGVKIAAGNVEADLQHVVSAGCDFVTIDGAQGGTADSPEVTINNVGLPIVYVIPRADRFLKQAGVRDRITLIASGGLKDAGDYMKALALGADAVYSGQSMLIAMAYSQLHKVPPGKTPAEMYLYWGDYHDRLDIEEGAKSVANFIKASTTEMQMLAGVVGKSDLRQVNTEDMVALTHEMAEVTGVAHAW